MKKLLLITLFVMVLFFSAVSLCFTENSALGVWEFQSIGVPEPMLLEFEQGEIISQPDYPQARDIPYNPQEQNFLFPELGMVSYTVQGDKMEVFFTEIDEDHPFLQSFMQAFESGFSNEVEERFISSVEDALVEVFLNTPFMIGYKVED